MKRRALMRVGGLIIGLMLTVALVAPASASTIVSISSGDSFSFGTFDGDASGVVVSTPPSSTPAAQNPIPSTLLLLASGLGGVVAYRKKFKT